MAESKNETALVLDDESYTGTDAVHFADFPGVYMPGKPVAVAELGFDTEKDALDRVKELGLPLKKTTVKTTARSGLPERPNHMPSQAEARVKAYDPEKDQPGAELDESEVFPPDPPPATRAEAELHAEASGAAEPPEGAEG